MLAEHVALLVDRGRGQGRLAGEEGERLPEDPGISDRPAGHAHAVHASLVEHRHAGLGREEIARADHDLLARVPLHRREKLPVARADVFLLHGAAVHGDRRCAAGEGAVEDGPEVVEALRRVVEAAAHLERDGHVRRHRLANLCHDLKRDGGLREEVAAAAAAEHFLHRAAEVDVDDVVALGHEPLGGRRKVVGIRAHQLAADGMFLVGHREAGEVAAVGADGGHELIEEHLAERVGRAVAAGQHPHGAVAVAGEGRLHDGRRDRHAADRKKVAASFFWSDHVSTGHMSNHVRPWACIHSKLESGPQSPSS